jgi:hypothetical protein
LAAGQKPTHMATNRNERCMMFIYEHHTTG